MMKTLLIYSRIKRLRIFGIDPCPEQAQQAISGCERIVDNFNAVVSVSLGSRDKRRLCAGRWFDLATGGRNASRATSHGRKRSAG